MLFNFTNATVFYFLTLNLQLHIRRKICWATFFGGLKICHLQILFCHMLTISAHSGSAKLSKMSSQLLKYAILRINCNSIVGLSQNCWRFALLFSACVSGLLWQHCAWTKCLYYALTFCVCTILTVGEMCFFFFLLQGCREHQKWIRTSGKFNLTSLSSYENTHTHTLTRHSECLNSNETSAIGAECVQPGRRRRVMWEGRVFCRCWSNFLPLTESSSALYTSLSWVHFCRTPSFLPSSWFWLNLLTVFSHPRSEDPLPSLPAPRRPPGTIPKSLMAEGFPRVSRRRSL